MRDKAPRAGHRRCARRSTAAPGTFEADEKALRALLVNLVENSLDACRARQEEAGTRGRRSGSARDGAACGFEVEDNGIGMDRETREKAFSLFFSSKGTEGTGLGLFIANKIATAHGGTIADRIDTGRRHTLRRGDPEREADRRATGRASRRPDRRRGDNPGDTRT